MLLCDTLARAQVVAVVAVVAAECHCNIRAGPYVCNWQKPAASGQLGHTEGFGTHNLQRAGVLFSCEVLIFLS